MNWCRTHRASESAEDGTCEVVAVLIALENWTRKASTSPPCDIVSAIIIERDADGNWPPALITAMEKRGYDGDWDSNAHAEQVLDDLSDALASAQETR